CGPQGLLCNKKQPKPGDLIEIFRSGYQHWAVYIGGGYVVHFVLNGDSTVPVQGGMGVVLKEKLEEVVGNNRWKINNYLDGKNKPQKVYAIVKQAVGFIGNQLHYNLATYNCKHFATELRYGKPVSQQVGQRRLKQSLPFIGMTCSLVGCPFSRTGW
uniref:LRAT domain-containing protein n=1 Tax=Fundulus heteroclitus TaxID=8078 RepID=A0A3Q2UIJ4_FUNHE